MGPIARLFPADGDISAAELLGSVAELLPLVDSLFDAERATLGRSVDSRRADYAAARTCARTALGRLGVEPVAILNRADRSPIWPDGIVGSLTHTRGYCAAAVARAGTVASLGIDVEPDAPLPEGVGERVLSAGERSQFAVLPAGPHWDRLAFCVKEATYKTWFPLAQCWLGFEDAAVTFEPTDRTVRVRLLREPLVVGGVPHWELTGRWAVADGFLGAVVQC